MNARCWTDLQEGLSADCDVVVTEEMMDRVAMGTDRVAYGLLAPSFYSTLASAHLPGARCVLHGIRIDFKAPVYVGDRLKVHGVVVHRSDAPRQVEIACEIRNAAHSLVSKSRLRIGPTDE